MKPFTLSAMAGIIATLISLFMLIGCGKPFEKEKQYVETIKNISAQRAKAFNEGDAASIASFFASDCFLMAPGGATKRTPKDVQAYYQSIFDTYHTELESGYEEVKVDGNLAYGRGYAKVKLVNKKDSSTQFSTAKYLNILEKQPDGRWLTTHDIWNNNESK
jgi:uncharacterized protein (TIGR02246 family)